MSGIGVEQQGIAATGSPGGGLPPGAADNTLRFNGLTAKWEASTTFLNDGTDIFNTNMAKFGTIGNPPISNVHAEGINPMFGERTSADTIVTRTPLSLNHKTTGDMADGFGTNMQLFIEDNAAVLNRAGQVSGVREGADDTSGIFLISVSGGSLVNNIHGLPNGSVILGNAAITAVQGNLPYATEYVIRNSGFDGNLDAIITAPRKWTLPDATGLIPTMVAVGVAGTVAENQGIATTSSRSDHEHSVNQTINVTIPGVIATGAGQAEFFIEVPNDNYQLVQISGRLITKAGTAFTIQVREINAANASQGDVINGAGLVFGGASNVRTTDLVVARTTPGANFYYLIDVDTITGSPPEDLNLQFRFTELTDDKPV